MRFNPLTVQRTLNTPLTIHQTTLHDTFWSRYTALVRDVVIPYQWEALNDRIEGAEPSFAMHNFRIAAGIEEGEFGGMVFQDSDLYKWLESVAYRLATHPDSEWEALADEVIDLIAQAQQEDGYLNTYFTIKEPTKRWTNLHEAHELYCAGHYIEAAVAYFHATGKRKALDVACQLADHIDRIFGPEPHQLHGYCGHQEIELALVKLYTATKNERYLQLSLYMINERGQMPNYFTEEWSLRGGVSIWSGNSAHTPHLEYNQSHLPVREQKEAVGHSVRAVYMYKAMADLAAHTGDDKLLEACRQLWHNTVNKQMYITGGIGSTHHGEAFSADYDLPNDTVYAETCASVGLVFFAGAMLQLEARSEYADVMERALYNTVIAGMALDGKHYFYVNPLEVWPHACKVNPGKHHVKPVRQPWFGCSCCPPNIARLLTSLGQYIYNVNAEEHIIYTHLYIASEASLTLNGSTLQLKQQSNMPWEGKVTFSISELSGTVSCTLALRIPSWCGTQTPSILINGESIALEAAVKDGYIHLTRTWENGDTVSLELPMPILRMAANTQVRSNAGRIALQRGPFVYCLEETDHSAPLTALTLPLTNELEPVYDADLFGGTMLLKGLGQRDTDATEGTEQGPLYRPISVRSTNPTTVQAVPYALWGNRTPGEMTVWIRYS